MTREEFNKRIPQPHKIDAYYIWLDGIEFNHQPENTINLFIGQLVDGIDLGYEYSYNSTQSQFYRNRPIGDIIYGNFKITHYEQGGVVGNKPEDLFFIEDIKTGREYIIHQKGIIVDDITLNPLKIDDSGVITGGRTPVKTFNP